MAVDVNYLTAMGNGIAAFAPSATAYYPAGMSPLTTPYVDLGSISVAGLTENPSETRTDFKRWGNISTVKSVITDEKRTFDVSFLEPNPNVLGLFYKVPTPAISGAGTNEVQTVTISGVPTGGSFTLTFAGYTTAPLAYNAAAADIQTALQALPSVGVNNVTVTGAVGGPFTLTFVGNLSETNVPNLTATASLTGGTTPGVGIALTTAGIDGQLMHIVDDTTGKRDVRSFVFDVLEGNTHFRFFIPTGEVSARKNVVYKTDSLVEYGVTITAYPNSNGVSVDRQFRVNAVVLGI